ncbi:hypothetical protein A2U01_0083146 [Trifolium medium]|uniref:Uncharacterized protein n=1 Tax=Trifolium medium TaxID=97028 RepID=A0A392TL40_9FABA|nr:hypothetical protein [Trifolium medium]
MEELRSQEEESKSKLGFEAKQVESKARNRGISKVREQ